MPVRFVFAAPAAAYASVQPISADASLTTGRLVGTAAALVAGLIGMVIGAVNLAVADGGPGTGNGVVGSAAAIVLGFIAIGLDRIASTREASRPRGPAGDARRVM